MMLLATFSDIKALKPISNNVDLVKKVDLAIADAQEFDIRPLIGESFYLDIIANPSNYDNLLNKTDYEDGNNDKFQSPGLINCIALFAYVRIKNDANEHETAYGSVNKTNPYSTGISEATKVRQLKELKDQANYYWNRIELYLNEKSTDYPLWKKSNCCYQRKNRSVKFYGTK